MSGKERGPARSERGQICETNPICTRAEESVGQAPPYKRAQSPNEPNSARRGGDAQPIRLSLRAGSTKKRAKQSQFRAGPGGTRPEGQGPWRAIVRNEANSGWPQACAAGGIDTQEVGRGRPTYEETCETNPISGTGRTMVNPSETEGYDELDRQKRSEKQSQWGGEFQVGSVSSSGPGPPWARRVFRLQATLGTRPAHFTLGRRPFVRNEPNRRFRPKGNS